MNDTTLPIPSKRASNPRRRAPEGKVRPGFGLHDWMTLLRRAKDLAQRKGAPLRRDIPLAEVRTHDKPYDGWVVLRGKVYNISPYLPYHPGGSAILEKCLGRDATALFDKYHSWVNLDGLIGPLLLGYLQVEKKRDEDEDGGGYLKGNVSGGAPNNSSGDSNVVIPPAASSAPSANSSPSNDDIGFAMPKPRPPKGEPISALLPCDNEDDEEEDETLKF